MKKKTMANYRAIPPFRSTSLCLGVRVSAPGTSTNINLN
jgi:hypothetical protein